MALRKRISRPSGRRPPTEPLVPFTTTRKSRVAGAFLLLVLLTSPGGDRQRSRHRRRRPRPRVSRARGLRQRDA
jgi:hypothetical protein